MSRRHLPTPRNSPESSARRDLLKLIGTGAVGAAALETLPGRWTKPIVDSVVLPLHAQSSSGPVNFQSATLGPTGLNSGGYTISDQFLGVRFTLASPGVTTAIGIHAYGSGSVWGAVVQLTGPADFPDSFDLLSADVRGTAVLSLPPTSAQVQSPLVLNLAAGSYALVFGGNNKFGSSGTGAALVNNPEIGTPSWFFLNTPGPPSWANGGINNLRMFLI